jgi:hypothetical protein
MRRRAAAVIAVTSLALTISAVGLTPATAVTDLTGRWITDSLRDNRIGYSLTLRPGESGGYAGTLTFVRQDGRQEGTREVMARVSGSTVSLRSKTGAFDRASGVLRGELSDDGESIVLTNCQARLRLVMARDLASDCTFLRVATR